MIKTKMNTLKLKPVFIGVVVIALGITPIHMLQAQETESQEADKSEIELITVTSRGRPEVIQEVPLSITAFSQEDMKRRSISELDDVARFTPGFSFEDFSGGFATPIIRGQAQTSVTALEQNVATFFDGLYIPRSWAIDIGTSNVERIEIVKGPQSARYGRNAFAGAINYIPVKAAVGDDEISGNIDVVFGSDERVDYGGFIQIPISEKFAIAASYNTSEFDGSWENSHPYADLDIGDDRSTNGNVGGRDNTSYSISLAAEPTEKWKFDLAYYNYEVKNEARAGRAYDHNYNTEEFNCGNTQFGKNLLICGEIPAPDETTIVDPRAYGVHANTDTIRFSTSYALSDMWSVSYLYGKIEGDTDIGTSSEPDPINCGTILNANLGFADLCNFQTTPIGGIEYDSHELRFSFVGDKLSAAFGGYISSGEDDYRFISFNIAPITDPNDYMTLVNQVVPSYILNPGPFNSPLANELTKTDVNSIFGELQWTSEDGATRAGTEVRYAKTEVDLLNNRSGEAFNAEFNAVTPRFTVEHDLNDDSLLFASLAKGNKGGGFNGSATFVEDQTFGEETNWVAEIGSKNTFLDGDLVLNGSVYFIDWSDIQVQSADPGSDSPQNSAITLNLGDAEVFGFEIDTVYLLTDNLTVDATFSYADSTYKNGTKDQRLARPSVGGGTPCDDIVCNSDGEVGGNDTERTPKSQASLGIQWEGSLDSGYYYIRSDLSWQSKFYATTANVATIPSRTLLNLSAGIDLDNGISLNVWAKNATDEIYTSNAFVVISPFNDLYNLFYGERRTVGLNASYKF
ncbi:TonB-dependent receptor [Aliiglaciecola sp. SL4]|uniref:TonB-dependent receptor n=1 Tax=Aliiglaciecola sp. SL4 TaxID=3239806 RepID=UPI00355B81B8